MEEEIFDLDIEVDPDDHENGILRILEYVRPHWKKEEVKFELLKQGLVNLMLLCKVSENQDEWLVVRVFGTDLNLLQDRDREIRCSKLLAELDVGAPVYASFSNGVVFGFVKGTTFIWNDLTPFRDIKLANAIAKQLARLHSKTTRRMAIEKYSVSEGKTVEDLVRSIVKNWPDVIVDEETTTWFSSKILEQGERHAELEMLLKKIHSLKIGTCLCHGNCNPTNIICDLNNEKATLVDLELSALSNPAYDLANYLTDSAVGFEPSPEGLQHTPEYQREFLRTYLTELKRLDEPGYVVTEADVDKMCHLMQVFETVYAFFLHIICVPLAVAPAKHNDDRRFFLRIAIARYQYYAKNKTHMLELIDRLTKDGHHVTWRT